MKKSLLFMAFLLIGFVGFGQSDRPYIIRYKTQSDTVCLNTQDVNGIHIDALGQELVHNEGIEWSALRDLDTVYVFPIELGEWVDLGLPSGLLWATCNVGASSPEDYGIYFAWAETQPKSEYSWSTYSYCCNGSYNSLTKYCNNSNYGCGGYTDNLTNLQSGDDAAKVQWGGEARIPTKEEWLELYNGCTSVWITQNGVDGRCFTGPNGNSIFLPAAGCRYENIHMYEGSNGYYWSSSLYTNDPQGAWSFYNNSNIYLVSYESRIGGRSVRAVRSAK